MPIFLIFSFGDFYETAVQLEQSWPLTNPVMVHSLRLYGQYQKCPEYLVGPKKALEAIAIKDSHLF
jgi:hypothetical protein